MPRRNLVLILFALLSPIIATAQNFDTSGNGSLKGDYFIREVLIHGQNPTTGAITSAYSVTGVATFDGKGGYSFTGQSTSTAAAGSLVTQNFSRTYSAASNGFLAVDSFITVPARSATSATFDICFGGIGAIGPSGFVASATEGIEDDGPNKPNVGPNVDILVGIPAGTSASAASLNGSYAMAYLDYLNADISSIRQASFTATANGAGSLGTLSVAGKAMNLSSGSPTTQTVTGANYTLGGKGVGTASFGAANAAQLISGNKTLYVSADGGIVLGGDPAGFDLLVGLAKTGSGPATNATASGVYYVATTEDIVDTTTTPITHSIDGYYGSTNLNGGGIQISHSRIQSFANNVFDFTYNEQFTVASDGTFTDGQFYNYALGRNGAAFVATGATGYYSLQVGFAAAQSTGTGVFLNPLGVVNAANFAPITNPVAPGEIVTLFGSGLAASTLNAATLPLPTSLGNVQVTVNGQAAPLFYVTAGQIAFLMPQQVSPFNKIYNATIQVVNNNVKSNPVTVYTALTAPGVFSAGGNGIGPAAAQHASGSFPLITATNPAKIGENVVFYATGLGSVTNPPQDGFPASGTTFSMVTDQYVELGFGGSGVTPAFAGLTPGLAGLYQLNAAVPAGTAAGSSYVNLYTQDGAASEATISISGSSAQTIAEEPQALRPRVRRQAAEGRPIRPQGLPGRAR